MVTRKSLGTLLDELITTNIKCFMAQETIMSDNSVNVVAEAAKHAQQLNARRNALIRAIDDMLDPAASSPTKKTYDKNSCCTSR